MIDFEKLLADTKNQLNEQKYIEFSADQLSKLRPDQVQAIIDEFHGYALFKIPKSEIDFFRWLKINDQDVWNDIWLNEDDLFLVSIDLLSYFIKGGLGFPICDLVDQPNYWFNAQLIKPKGMEELENIVAKLENGNKVSVSEAFLLEISTRPVDIWHFCYSHKLQVERVKKIVEDLVFQGFLVHLTDREDLVKYLDI